MVNNAGFGINGEQIEQDLNKTKSMLNLNIITLTELCTLFGKEMRKEKQGYILNIASTGAYQPVPYFASYAATKSYVLNFSEAIAKELKKHNITVTCLSPGVTNTNFFDIAGIGNQKKGMWKNKTRMSPKKVAQIGIHALFNKKISIVPGFMNNFLIFLIRLTPRTIVANIMKKLMGK